MGLFTKIQCKACKNEFRESKISEYGLCETCNYVALQNVVSFTEIFEDSYRIIESSKNIDTIISRYDLIIDKAETIYRGWDTFGHIKFTADEFVENSKDDKDQAIINHLNSELEKAKLKSKEAQTIASKISPFKKLKTLVEKLYRETYNKKKDIELFSQLLEAAINAIKYDDFIEKAKKFEFKGNNSKALDNYFEALYTLRTDNIEDSNQLKQIHKLEAKIRSLGGEIKDINTTLSEG